MSTLRITPRAATLATGHSVGAGQVNVPHHHIAHLSAGADETVKWRGVSDAGRGISDFGNAMLKISAVLAEERNEMQLNEFEADFNARVTQAELDKDKGFLTRHLANTGDLEKLATEGPREVKDIFDEVAEAHGMTGVKRSWAENRVRGRVSSVGKRIADRVATTHQALKVQAATRNTAAWQDAWRINRDDAESTHNLIDAFRAQQYAAGAGDDAAELAVGQFVNALAVEYAADKYGKLATAEQVDAAEKQLEENPAAILSGNNTLAKAFADGKSSPFDPASAKRLKGVLSARRHEIEAAAREKEAAVQKVEEEAIGRIKLSSANAQAKGDREKIEKAIRTIEIETSNEPEGSRIETAALVELKRLNSAADSLAWSEMVQEALDDPKKDFLKDGKPIYDERIDPRKYRLCAQFQSAVDRQRDAVYKASRPREIAACEVNAFQFAAAGDYAGYCDYLKKEVEEGRLSLEDYATRLRTFKDGWFKGVTSPTGDVTYPAQNEAKKLFAVTKDVFGVDLAEMVARDKGGRVVFDADGRVAYNPKLVEDEEEPLVKYDRRSETWRGLARGGWTVKEEISAKDWLEIVNMALRFANLNGTTVKTNALPEELKFLSDGKDEHKFSAEADFRAYCERLKGWKDIVSDAKSGSAETMVTLMTGTYATMMRDLEKGQRNDNLKEAVGGKEKTK